jgi:geranylgeranyl diphosphate synthase type II
MNEKLSVDGGRKQVVFDAMKYSINAGGKRIRPILTAATFEMMSEESFERILPFLAAIEFIHTFSLVHDDLPCMDNSDLRRGKLTCHKVFGEATASLAGLGLLTMALKIITESREFDSALILDIANELLEASGCDGMIGGQVMDLSNEYFGDIAEDSQRLDELYSLKTGALITVSVVIGAKLAGVGEDELSKLRKFSERLGLAFQIRDDILDVVGDEKNTGKPIGIDEKNHKITYVSLHGIDNSIEKLRELKGEALGFLENFNGKAWFLVKLTEKLLKM